MPVNASLLLRTSISVWTVWLTATEDVPQTTVLLMVEQPRGSDLTSWNVGVSLICGSPSCDDVPKKPEEEDESKGGKNRHFLRSNSESLFFSSLIWTFRFKMKKF